MSDPETPPFDYTPAKQLFDRAMQRFQKYGANYKQVWLHDQTGKRMKDIPMRQKFVDFVELIAHGIRRQVTYRSDKGRFARGLIIANGSLKRCHNKFLRLKIKENDPVPMKIDMVVQNAAVGDKDALELVFSVHYRKVRDLNFVPEPVEGDGIKIRDERHAIWLEAIFETRRLVKTLPFKRDQILVNNLLDFILEKGFHRIDEIWVFNGNLHRYLRSSGKDADRMFGDGITRAWIDTPLPRTLNKILLLRDDPDAMGREMLGQMRALARQIDTSLRIVNEIERRQIKIPRSIVPLGGLLSGGKDTLARPITGITKPKVIEAMYWMRDTDNPHLMAPYKIMRRLTLDNVEGTY